MRLVPILVHAERTAIGCAGIVALAFASWQVAERYVFPELGSIWADEAVIYVIGFATFLSVSVLVFDDKHVRADVVIRALPIAWQRWLELLNCALGLLFCGIVGWYGFELTLDAFQTDERSVTGSAFPIWFFYATLPLGMLLSVIWYLRRIHRITLRFDAAEFSVSSGHEA
jgi:TRAP-type C4-dicarboxylate transport system permease small subunit